MSSVGGSSPLARGLLAREINVHAHVRIIPARAGFTSVGRVPAHDVADHPRSRGVYTHPPSPIASRAGSSPLARGLHERDGLFVGDARIIPARAGFTSRIFVRNLRMKDHPRSRGVYPLSRPRSSSRSGSSPLARGLPFLPTGESIGIWIIPARAGFTLSQSIPKLTDRDHPRSRGVYSPSPARWWRARGSSPLARGLPHLLRRRQKGDVDHPRSRGVYLVT